MSSPPPNSHPREYGSNSDGYGYKTPKGSRLNKAKRTPKKPKKTKKARRHSPVRQPNFNSTTTTTVASQPNVGSTSTTTTTRGRANSFNNMLRNMGNLNEARAVGEPGYAEAELKRMKNK